MMKKGILLIALLFSVVTFAQKMKPNFEKEGKMVKATYFHDNGTVAQTGYLLEGKLHGQWYMYNQEGKKLATGKYAHGIRTGKWFFWKDAILKEVDFEDNQIAYVKNWNQAEVVAVNK
ncbi:Nicotinic acid mononucleotide adenyltransferase [Croceitalea dokdonensis DOKDO 023]|uniref:Nicotinic acid mononucleotide adenyltransferase n=2 Tax=Croceitalea TaxID=574891 RepID=A0A0P7AVL3_9FLAO|nr:Nicotinic acid mononucleotide adenyltransferase [Croceitalea dokdonensis DOKDO 023]